MLQQSYKNQLKEVSREHENFLNIFSLKRQQRLSKPLEEVK
jgi:hypothetical protein